MKNFPKILSTKHDVNVCLELFPEKTKSILKSYLDNYRGWISTGNFKTEEECIEDETHQYFKSTGMDEEITWVQQEFMVVPGNWIDRLGYTENEIIKIIGE